MSAYDKVMAARDAGLPVYNHIIGDEIKNPVQLF